jgi:hypothetical protein
VISKPIFTNNECHKKAMYTDVDYSLSQFVKGILLPLITICKRYFIASYITLLSFYNGISWFNFNTLGRSHGEVTGLVPYPYGSAIVDLAVSCLMVFYSCLPQTLYAVSVNRK